jgi:hypothetical protein
LVASISRSRYHVNIEEVGKMKYTKKRTPRKNQKQRDATFDKFKQQQNELNANRRGVRRK